MISGYWLHDIARNSVMDEKSFETSLMPTCRQKNMNFSSQNMGGNASLLLYAGKFHSVNLCKIMYNLISNIAMGKTQ